MINDLYDYPNLKIFQEKDKFKFSLDSILLAEYVNLSGKLNKIVDFCTGNAPVPLILSTKTKSPIWGIEIQKPIFELACKSVKINNLENQISIINDNVINIKKYFKPETIDIVTCNPPYYKCSSGLENENYEKAVARHEILINLEEIIKTASYILKSKGALYIIHRPDRLEEISELLNQNNFKIKKMTVIYNKVNENGIAIIVKAIKNGASGLVIEKPIIISDIITYREFLGGKIMKMIVGLGNPGRKYQNTRHNIGFIVINNVFGSLDWQEKFEGQYRIINIAGSKILLVQPLTFMNLSGVTVRAFAEYYDVMPRDILVIRDDLDLPLANVRIKKNSSDGGHNGIKSIAESLGTNSFCQLKVGIASGNIIDAKKYVLKKFNKEEKVFINNKTELINKILEAFADKDIEWVMNQYNNN